MLPKESLHENTYGVRVVVLSQVLDARELQHFFFLEIIFLKYRLLQDIHQDFQCLIQLAAQAVNNVTEEIRLVYNLDSSARVLEPPCDVFGVESLSATQCCAEHQLGDTGVLRRLI